MANRTEVTVVDGSTRYPFTIHRDEQTGRDVTISTKPWEVGDSQGYWKKPLHPWDGGLANSRLFNEHVYAKANADLTNEGLLVPPPLINGIKAIVT